MRPVDHRVFTRLAGLAGVLLALLMPASRPAFAGEPLTVAVSRTSLSLPVFVAQERGYFAQAGVEVRSTECLGGQRCIVEMLEGRADIATATELPVTFQSFKRNDFAIFATFVTATQDVKVLVRRGAGIERLAQLAGKRVATVKATSAHYYLDSALLFEGVDPQQLDLIGLPPEQVGPALVAGRVDAAVVWEPFAYETLRALGGDGVVVPGVRIYAATFNLVARHELLARREADLVKVLQALERAVRFIRDEPLQAQAILKARLDVDDAFVAATWNDYRYRLALNQSLVSTLEGQARWALREGHVPASSRTPNMLQFVAPALLAKAVPGAVTLVK